MDFIAVFLVVSFQGFIGSSAGVTATEVGRSRTGQSGMSCAKSCGGL